MHKLTKIILSLVAAIGLVFGTMAAQAQIVVGVHVGHPHVVLVEPYCPYGYYDYAPYACSPYGFYGPEYFDDGIFIGVGPWYHNSRGYFYDRNGYYIGHDQRRMNEDRGRQDNERRTWARPDQNGHTPHPQARAQHEQRGGGRH